MEGIVKWLAETLLIPVLLALGGGAGTILVAKLRRLDRKIDENKDKTDQKISASNRVLHERIDEVKDEFVSHDTLDRRMDGVNKRLDDIREDGQQRGKDTSNQLAAINGRMDMLFEKLGR